MHKAFLLLILIVVSGCGSHVKRSLHLEPHEVSAPDHVSIQPIPTITDPRILREYEAHLVDITPIMGAQLKRGSMESDDRKGTQWLLEYEITAQPAMIIDWYQRHMEYTGWIQVRELNSFHTLMLFGKPDKYCHISIMRTSKRNGWTILLWVLELAKPL